MKKKKTKQRLVSIQITSSRLDLVSKAAVPEQLSVELNKENETAVVIDIPSSGAATQKDGKIDLGFGL